MHTFIDYWLDFKHSLVIDNYFHLLCEDLASVLVNGRFLCQGCCWIDELLSFVHAFDYNGNCFHCYFA